MVTGAFLVGIDGLVVLQGLIVTRLLGPSEIGLYGIVPATVVTVLALERIGIDEAFIALPDRRGGSRPPGRRGARARHGRRRPARARRAGAAPAAAYDERRLLSFTLGLSWPPWAFALLAPP